MRDARDTAVSEAEAGRAEALSEAERLDSLLSAANMALSVEQAVSAESQREVALLNEQVAELRSELGRLKALLDLADERDAQAQVQIETLSAQLNTATLRRLAEESRRAELEEELRRQAEAEAERLAAEAQNLERYRSEFFGELRQIVGQTEGIRIVGRPVRVLVRGAVRIGRCGAVTGR